LVIVSEQQIPNQTPRVGYVPGGFDMLHVGHINVLIAARDLCDYLVVGVATDESGSSLFRVR